MKEISLEENFNNVLGKFENYDALDPAQRSAVLQQSHVDVRNFRSEDVHAHLIMIHLDRARMSDMELQPGGTASTMADLEGTALVQQGERWTQGTVGRISGSNNWHGLTLNCTTGTNTTYSIR